MPRVGSSNRRGFQFSLAWYQVIDRNLDATIHLDYYSKLGIGKGLEYRYIAGKENEGLFHLYHVTGLQSAKDRYAFDWRHSGQLPGDIRLAADVLYVSSRDYFKDFGEVAGEYNKDEAQSIIWAGHNWHSANLAGQLRYTKNLEAPNDQTLQKLPQAVFTALPYRLGEMPFYLALQSGYTYFWRQEGSTGQRLTYRPELSAVFQPGGLLEIRPAIGYRERLYWIEGEGSGSEQDGLADFSTRLSTRFSRVFAVAGEKIRRYATASNPNSPIFISPPKISRDFRNSIPWIPLNRRIGSSMPWSIAWWPAWKLPKANPIITNFLYLRLSQGYDIREERRDSDPGSKQHPFTPLRAELTLRPNTWSYLDLLYNINAGGGSFTDRIMPASSLANQLTTVSARSGVRDSAGNGFALDYQYQENTLDYLGATVDIAWLRPVYLNYQQRQDLKAGRVLERLLNLEYRAQCWSLFLTLRDRLEGTEYLVSFALSGRGQGNRSRWSTGWTYRLTHPIKIDFSDVSCYAIRGLIHLITIFVMRIPGPGEKFRGKEAGGGIRGPGVIKNP